MLNKKFNNKECYSKTHKDNNSKPYRMYLFQTLDKPKQVQLELCLY